MIITQKIKIIILPLSSLVLVACKETSFVNNGHINGAAINQQLRGHVIYEYTKNNEDRVILSLENGCALRAEKKSINHTDKQLFIPEQFACNQLTNQTISEHDATILFDAATVENNTASDNVLLVQINKRHMPLLIIKTPEKQENEMWQSTYSEKSSL